MVSIKDLVEKYTKEGYSVQNAEARICQDIILLAISNSTLDKHVTIKGSVVIRSLTGDVRRATQDLDIDFIRYSLSDESIERFIRNLNCIDGIRIYTIGIFEELRQQEYRGKRVNIVIEDNYNNMVKSKIDFGVHKNLSIEQEEYCFDICLQEDKVSLLVNSCAQMMAEKLRSLLKFGIFSTRFKDVFDLMYLKDLVDIYALKKCMATYIYEDTVMRENNIFDVRKRIKSIFDSSQYILNLSNSGKNWLQLPVKDVIQSLKQFFDQNMLE